MFIKSHKVYNSIVYFLFFLAFIGYAFNGYLYFYFVFDLLKFT